MSPPPVSRDLAKVTIAAVEDALRNGHKPIGHSLGRHEIGCTSAAARKLETSHSVVTNRLAQAKKLYKLEPDWTLYTPTEIDAIRAGGNAPVMPSGHALKAVSSLLGPDGELKGQWVKTVADRPDPAEYVRELEEAFKNFKPAAKPVKAPKLTYEDQLTLYPWSDPHIGLMVWGREASENWDLKIGVDTIRETFRQVVARTAPTKQAILLVGGDTLHADNNLNRTPQSGHALQVDGRHQKVILTACETIVANIDLLLGKHEKVEVIAIPGNHDETSAYPIAMFLAAWYRQEPRVNVDLSPGLFRFREYGKVMIGTTHGHAAKAKDMPGIMAAREAVMWGRTVHRFVHTFHVHHSSKLLSEGGGCIAETHQIIAPQDAWHYGAGFLSGRSMQSICYDRERGEVSRVRVAVG